MYMYAYVTDISKPTTHPWSQRVPLNTATRCSSQLRLFAWSWAWNCAEVFIRSAVSSTPEKIMFYLLYLIFSLSGYYIYASMYVCMYLSIYLIFLSI